MLEDPVDAGIRLFEGEASGDVLLYVEGDTIDQLICLVETTVLLTDTIIINRSLRVSSLKRAEIWQVLRTTRQAIDAACSLTETFQGHKSIFHIQAQGLVPEVLYMLYVLRGLEDLT